MEPISMFDTCPHCNGSGMIDFLVKSSRKNDPKTSKQAGKTYAADARRFSTKSNQAKLLKLLNNNPMTAQEAALKVLGSTTHISSLEACRRRVSDLSKAGYVTDSGEKRKNLGSPDESIVWEITSAGKTAINNLISTGWATVVTSNR